MVWSERIWGVAVCVSGSKSNLIGKTAISETVGTVNGLKSVGLLPRCALIEVKCLPPAGKEDLFSDGGPGLFLSSLSCPRDIGSTQLSFGICRSQFLPVSARSDKLSGEGK